MSFTYSGDPSADARSAVRFLAGDTEKVRSSLTDAEIDFILSEYEVDSTAPYSNYQILRLASAQAAEALAAKYSKEAAYAVGGVNESADQKAREYRITAARLRREATKLSLPFVGGRSKATKETAEANSNLPQAAFTREMMYHPNTGNEVIE